MSDAWETLIAVSSSGDAWERLNSATVGSSPVPGSPVDELRFIIEPVVTITGAINTPGLTGSVGALIVTPSINVTTIAGTTQTFSFEGNIEVGEL